MTARSIFQKVCPGCMTTLPSDAKQCTCGFDFDVNAITGPSSGEIRLNAEELYETYLAARAQQAASALKTIQKDMVRDPANKKKSAQLLEAMDEAHAAKEALAAQSAHIAQLRKSQQTVIAPAATPLPVTPVPVVTPIPMSVSVPVPVVVPINTQAIKRIEQRTMPPKKRIVASVSIIRAAPKVSDIAAKKEVGGTKRKTNTVTLTVTKKNPPLTPVRKIPEVVPVKTPLTIHAHSQPTAQTAQPNEAFRQVQAARAEKILREASDTKPEVSKTVALQKEIAPKARSFEEKLPVVSSALKTAPRLYVPNDKRECPNCTSAVAANQARCRCGYEFPSVELIPSLSMSEEERAEFAKLFSSL